MKNTNQSFAVYAPNSTVTGGTYVLTPFDDQSTNGGIYIVDKKHSRTKFRRIIRATGISAVLVFASVGIVFTGVFVALRFGLLNVRGSSKSRDAFYQNLPSTGVLAASVPKTANPTACVQEGVNGKAVPICDWNKSEEWTTLRSGFAKDKNVILRASEETGVPARMIVAAVAPEQIRFFTSDRENFKQYFEPYKALGQVIGLSLGIAGIKPATAKLIEQNTLDHNSPFYAGKGMAKLVAYPAGINADNERINRISDYSNHYYPYLYAALYIKEIQAQWDSEGFDISGRPDVVSTLYNIGFDHSHPKPNPDTGGADIHLGSQTYNFGELGTIFYRSEELTAIFPRSD